MATIIAMGALLALVTNGGVAAAEGSRKARAYFGVEAGAGALSLQGFSSDGCGSFGHCDLEGGGPGLGLMAGFRLGFFQLGVRFGAWPLFSEGGRAVLLTAGPEVALVFGGSSRFFVGAQVAFAVLASACDEGALECTGNDSGGLGALRVGAEWDVSETKSIGFSVGPVLTLVTGRAGVGGWTSVYLSFGT